MLNPSNEYWSLLIKTVSYLYQTIDKCLTLRSREDKNVKLEAYVDSDFAGNTDDRKSITGYVVLLNGSVISWKSKKQPTVTLSSTEAEYVALTYCVMEIQFVMNLLKEMGVAVDTPVIVNEDNAGALFLAKNHSLGQRTKHIDIKYHYVRDLVENGFIEIKYVQTNWNLADIMTKSLGEEKHDKFAEMLLNGKKVEVKGEA